MKLLSIFLIITALISPSACLAQEASYRDQIAKLIDKTEEIDTFLRTSPIDYVAYDRWYKEFREVNDKFLEDFYISHRQQKSFQAVREGANELSLAWSMLYQAKYAEDQYQESITTNAIDYAHKWKATEMEEQKKAVDELNKATSAFRRAKEALSSEGD